MNDFYPDSKFKVGQQVYYYGPTFPKLHGLLLTIMEIEPSNKARYVYTVRQPGLKRGQRVWESSLSVDAPIAKAPILKKRFAVGAKVKTSNGVLEGIIKEILGDDRYILETPSARLFTVREHTLVLVTDTPVPDRAMTFSERMGFKPTAKQRDDAATLAFIAGEQNHVEGPTTGLWQDGRRVRASLPGLLTRKSTLHTKPVRVVVSALPGAMRYVP
jgi:hypothetical protein